MARDLKGNTTECENEYPGDDCCSWISDEVLNFHMAFESAQCKEICATLKTGVAPTIPYTCKDLE